MRTLFLKLQRFGYEQVIRRVIFRSTAQQAHHRMLRLLAWLDGSPPLCGLLTLIKRTATINQAVTVGGVTLHSPFILAAGLVKGEGFTSESEALTVVALGRNIVPGWRAMPAIAGLVEFGSFTRHPRMGNPGVVVWRDEPTRSTQNRVGLKNPGARAAAAFLTKHRQHLPQVFGINIATSPGITNLSQELNDVLEAFAAFVEKDIYPAWFTLNLSCPNTEDDPSCRQTETQTRQLCSTVLSYLRSKNVDTPLWVKISPELAPEQYQILMQVFHQVGVNAVIATNTMPRPALDDSTLVAGIGGGQLHQAALAATRYLVQEKVAHSYAVDVIGCGGVMDALTAQAFLDSGAKAVQYWSALIYRGPLAAAVIAGELEHGRTSHAGRPRLARN